jgi:hypothetical protein
MTDENTERLAEALSVISEACERFQREAKDDPWAVIAHIEAVADAALDDYLTATREP